ncbi:hypothetical protein M2360_000771 [Rhizobium sp. SG_E_25_P2]|uniref:hypothetical protein n=1 Tax=Rhizobium sp. SG_E_25_P2 TaxID=2879942 RepID=UPI0024740143|nr:hypothetical protein [Rhizobium sp. SG_E_25_P2]MDH6265390.1 hypothetical protein [Rhizobium sp. SG_E_25_P2]
MAHLLKYILLIVIAAGSVSFLPPINEAKAIPASYVAKLMSNADRGKTPSTNLPTANQAAKSGKLPQE